MNRKTKILIGILIVGIILAGGWWVWNSQKQAPVEEFCTANVLEDCDGKKVNITGKLKYIPKGKIPILTNIENREAKYTWGGIFLDWQEDKVSDITEGAILNIIGMVSKGGQPCSPPGRPEQCMAPYHATNIKVESVKVVKNTEDVTITTDKTEYEQGETVNITVRNGLDKSIWYIKEVCPSSCCNLYKWENNKWENLGDPIPCWSPPPPLPGESFLGGLKPDLLEPEAVITKQWDMTTRYGLAESGKYRFSFYYGLSENNFTEKTIYSPEFTIKEKSATDPRCEQKVKGTMVSGTKPCTEYREGYEFDSSVGKCTKKGASGCLFIIPFNTLEECQEVCENKERAN